MCGACRVTGTQEGGRGGAWIVTGTQEGGAWGAWRVTGTQEGRACGAWRVTGTQEGRAWRAWRVTGTQKGSHTGPEARRKCLKGDTLGPRFPEPQRVDLLPRLEAGSGVLGQAQFAPPQGAWHCQEIVWGCHNSEVLLAF